MNVKEINPIVLAYLGDAIYELYVRTFLISNRINKVNDLQKSAVEFVSARAQAKFLNNLLEKDLLLEEELLIIKRARNAKSSTHPKNVDILTYKHATALEALFGYLYILDKKERLNEIIKEIIGENYECIW